jgi:hypothetical protein
MVNSAQVSNANPRSSTDSPTLIIEVFGRERGAHARSAVGLAELPFRIPVEIEGWKLSFRA